MSILRIDEVNDSGEVLSTPAISKITAVDEGRAINTLVLAFGGDPAVRWLYPKADDYLVNFPRFVSAFAGKAFEHGSAYVIGDHAGEALWLPPNVQPDEEALIALVRQTVSERKYKDLFDVLEQMGHSHPSEPHWYLPLIGIDPLYQGRGYGGALMANALTQCDHDQKLAYLESSNPKNIPLYERHGFELIGKIHVGESPTIFPMLRKPG